jgi:hypothetical protein
MQDYFPSKFASGHPHFTVRPDAAMAARHELGSVCEHCRNARNRRGGDIEELLCRMVECLMQPIQLLGRFFVTFARHLVEFGTWVEINPSAPVRLDCS